MAIVRILASTIIRSRRDNAAPNTRIKNKMKIIGHKS